ncbi:MAG TPA: Gfo/Idh/MocA family oxidoreductase [Armatimonadota bacterium]|nr:Gfo/Idh/MocA family oxidoreductase [Armatimonadota bacterium]
MADKLTAVLAGCGSMSHAWLSAAKAIDNLELVGLVDLNEEAARARAKEFDLPHAAIGSDLEAMLAKTRPDIVFDVTIPEAHRPITLLSLANGCHVLGEKPLADSMEHAREMVASAQKAGKLFAVIQNRRYDPRIRRLRHFLQTGVLGPLTTVDSDFYIGAHFGGFRDHMEHVLLLDMAIHTFDAARYLIGADPVSVYCEEWNPAGSWYDHDASAVAIFEMANGIRYTYRGSWCAEGLNTTWECDWRLIGENGTSKWDGSEGYQTQVVAERGGFHSTWKDVEMPPFDAGEKVGGHAGLIREFVHCVENGTVPETIAADNIKSLAMVFGAIESANQQRRVAITW